jgi:hypothetical protein
MSTEHAVEVTVRRHNDVPECDVVVAFRGQEASIRCRDYNQAVLWARIECKAYKIASGFNVESHKVNPPPLNDSTPDQNRSAERQGFDQD